MKDADVAEHSSPLTDQIVSTTILAQPDQEILPAQRSAGGQFLSGHNGYVTNGGSIAQRTRAILETQSVAEINYHMTQIIAGNLKGLEAHCWRRAWKFIHGEIDNQDTMDRIEGAVPKNVKHSAPDGGPIKVVTADCTELLVAALTKKDTK